MAKTGCSPNCGIQDIGVKSCSSTNRAPEKLRVGAGRSCMCDLDVDIRRRRGVGRFGSFEGTTAQVPCISYLVPDME